MNVEIVLLRDLEDAQQLHRVVAERLGRGHDEAIAFQAEAFHLAAAPQGRQAEARAPVVLRLDDGAEDAREVADFLGDEEVALHEALDVHEAAVRREAHARRDLLLRVAGETFVGTAREIMNVAAQGPQAVPRLLEAPLTRPGNNTTR